jgi:hypothetical protein
MNASRGLFKPSVGLDRLILSVSLLIAISNPRTGAAVINADIRYLARDFQVNDNIGTCMHYRPDVAMDNNGNWVTIWYDERNNHPDIYAQRFNNNGQPIGANFRVNDDQTKLIQDNPCIAMDGSGNYIIAWMDARGDLAMNVYAQRFRYDGTRIGANVKVSEANLGRSTGFYAEERPIAIAVNSAGEFVITWLGFAKIFMQRYNVNGEAIGKNITVLEKWNYLNGLVDVAINTLGTIAVIWKDMRSDNKGDIYCQFYDNNNKTIGANVKVNDDAGSHWQSFPCIGVDGNGAFTAFWTDIRAENNITALYAQRFQSNGTLVGANKLLSDASVSYPDVRMENDGGVLISLLHQSNYVAFQRFNNQLAAITSAVRVSESIGGYPNMNQYRPRISGNSAGAYVIVWEEHKNGVRLRRDIYARRYSNGSAVAASFQINNDPGSSQQTAPDIEADRNGNFAIVWQDMTNGTQDIFSQRYNASGSRQGNPFMVNDNVGLGKMGVEYGKFDPSIDMDDAGNFLVAFQFVNNFWGKIYFQKYNSAGVRLTQPIAGNDSLSTYSQSLPVIKYSSDGAIVLAWDQQIGDFGQRFIQFRRFAGSATPLNRMQTAGVDSAKVNNSNPTMALDAIGNPVLAWQAQNPQNYRYTVYLQKFTPAGVSLWTRRKVVVGDWDQIQPIIAINNKGMLGVIWVDKRPGSWYGDIFGRIYDAQGNPLAAEFKLNDDTGGAIQADPTLAVDADGNFLAAWSDLRNNDYDIYGQRFNAQGSLSGDNFRIDTEPNKNYQRNPAITIAGNALITCWEDDRVAGQGGDIFANVIDLSSIPLTPTVAIPLFSPAAGTFTSPQSVSLLCSTTGAAIRYTLDGTEPTASSALYSAPISVAANVTIKARGFKTDWLSSPIATAAYIITGTVTAPVVSPEPGRFAGCVDFTMSCDTPGAVIYYSTDGSEPTTKDSLYKSPVRIYASGTVKAKAYKQDWAPSQTVSKAYEIAGLPISIETAEHQPIGMEWLIQIKIGSDGLPVRDLLGVSFKLNYSNTLFIDVVTPYTASILPGDFIGTEPVFFQTVSDSTGSMSAAISRKIQKGGMNGSGIILSARFTSSVQTPMSTPIQLTFSDVLALDARGVYLKTEPAGKMVVLDNVVAAPTFLPPAGSYQTSQVVTISCATLGATIRYTLDGKAPETTSALYSQPIAIQKSATVKARAYKNGLLASDISIADYKIAPTDVALQENLPATFALAQNYPNPFNASTTICYQLPFLQPMPVKLEIYNMLGAKVASLVDQVQSAGSYRIIWRASDPVGTALPAGIYLCRLSAGRFSQTEKLAVLK